MWMPDPRDPGPATGRYFVIEKLTGFEIDEIPSGAVGLKVTNAVWMRKPTNTGHGGSRRLAIARP